VCGRRDRGAVDVKVDTQCRGLGEDVGDLRFELGVNDSAAEAQLVLFMFRMLNSAKKLTVSRWACKNKMRTSSQ
jgi:hypothetical protein